MVLCLRRVGVEQIIDVDDAAFAELLGNCCMTDVDGDWTDGGVWWMSTRVEAAGTVGEVMEVVELEPPDWEGFKQLSVRVRERRLPEENTNEDVVVMVLVLEESIPPMPMLLEIVAKLAVALGRLEIDPIDVEVFWLCLRLACRFVSLSGVEVCKIIGIGEIFPSVQSKCKRVFYFASCWTDEFANRLIQWLLIFNQAVLIFQ